jgi:hypothetical protein
LSAGNGTKTVSTQWKDPSGHWTLAATDSIVLDTVDPTVTAPTRSFVAGAQLSAGAAIVRIGWSGSDKRSGIARYEIERTKDGGGWGYRASITSPSRNFALAAAHTYRFRVRAIDKAGNVGAWVTGASFRLSRYNETAATYKGSWSPISSPAYVGGAARWSSTAGSRLRFTFTGRSFGWLSDLGPARGRVAIYVNGQYVATVDLHAATQRGQVIAWSKSWATTSTRTVEIRVLSTPGSPRVDVDGFWVST